MDFVIIEVDDGLTVVELPAGADPEAVATDHGGVLVDAGPYRSYEDACDALADLEDEEEDQELA